MRISTGKVCGGAIDLDGDETFTLDPADEARLLEAIEEANRRTAVNSSQVLANIAIRCL